MRGLAVMLISHVRQGAALQMGDAPWHRCTDLCRGHGPVSPMPSSQSSEELTSQCFSWEIRPKGSQMNSRGPKSDCEKMKLGQYMVKGQKLEVGIREGVPSLVHL